MKLFGIAESMLSLLPDWRLPDEAIDNFSLALTETMKWDNFIPVRTWLSIFAWLLVFEITLMLYRLSASIIGFLRGTSSIDETKL